MHHFKLLTNCLVCSTRSGAGWMVGGKIELKFGPVLN